MKYKIKLTCSRLSQFIQKLFIQYFDNSSLSEAGNLTLTTLLAIVPLASVFLSLFSALPFFDSVMKPVQDIIFSHFIPSTGNIIQGYVATFSAKASRLSPSSVVLLFVTSVLLLNSISTTINKIWGITQKRTIAGSLMLYWSILSLGPIFVGLSFGTSAYIFSAYYFKNYNVNFLIDVAPFLFSWLGLAFLYIVIPNKKVKALYSLVSSFVAALLIELAKVSFALYFPNNNNYELIYGALAVIPMFIIWLFWVWSIVLLGATLNYLLHTFQWRGNSFDLNASEQLLVWLIKLDKSCATGTVLSGDELSFFVKPEIGISKEQLLAKAMKKKLIQQTIDGGYVLSTKLSSISFEDLLITIVDNPITYDETKLFKHLPFINKQLFQELKSKECFCKSYISNIFPSKTKNI